VSDGGIGVVTVYAVSDDVNVSCSPFSCFIKRNGDKLVGLSAVDGAVAVLAFATAAVLSVFAAAAVAVIVDELLVSVADCGVGDDTGGDADGGSAVFVSAVMSTSVFSSFGVCRGESRGLPLRLRGRRRPLLLSSVCERSSPMAAVIPAI